MTDEELFGRIASGMDEQEARAALEQADWVKIQVDGQLNPGQVPENDHEAHTWALLDTAYNLLRVGIVKVLIAELREHLVEQGANALPTDEQIFEAIRASGDPDGPTSYKDLAPDTHLARMGLKGVFGVLLDEASAMVEEGLAGVVEGK